MFEIIIFVLIESLAILVGSVFGFGASLVAIPLLALMFEPRLIVPAHIVICLVIYTVLAIESRQHLEWSRIKYLTAAGVVGCTAGTFVLKHFQTDFIKFVICIATLAFALLFSFNVTIPIKSNRRSQSIVGLVSGLLGGAIAQGGPPVVIYALGLKWKKDIFRTTLLTYFVGLSLVAVINYSWMGLFNKTNIYFVLWTVAPAILAGHIGIKIKNVASEKAFRKAVLCVVVIVALIGVAQVLFR